MSRLREKEKDRFIRFHHVWVQIGMEPNLFRDIPGMFSKVKSMSKIKKIIFGEWLELVCSQLASYKGLQLKFSLYGYNICVGNK